jgi:hypothetical protein
MKIFFSNDVSKEVKFDDYFLENGFLETFYEAAIVTGKHH